MSVRKDFEEFCRRTRPPLNTSRGITINGLAGYADGSTDAAWKAWQYLTKQNNPSSKRATAVQP
jgi:hypothetical protein